jgi:hypothetical protein
MLATRVLFLASVFNVRTCSVVHERRFDFLDIHYLRFKKDAVCSCVLLKRKAQALGRIPSVDQFTSKER